jgi:hypothetical protein
VCVGVCVFVCFAFVLYTSLCPDLWRHLHHLFSYGYIYTKLRLHAGGKHSGRKEILPRPQQWSHPVASPLVAHGATCSHDLDNLPAI